MVKGGGQTNKRRGWVADMSLQPLTYNFTHYLKQVIVHPLPHWDESQTYTIGLWASSLSLSFSFLVSFFISSTKEHVFMITFWLWSQNCWSWSFLHIQRRKNDLKLSESKHFLIGLIPCNMLVAPSFSSCFDYGIWVDQCA